MHNRAIVVASLNSILRLSIDNKIEIRGNITSTKLLYHVKSAFDSTYYIDIGIVSNCVVVAKFDSVIGKRNKLIIYLGK